MDYYFWCRLKKGNSKAFNALCEEELKRMWFICYHCTLDVNTAAELLAKAWKETVFQIVRKDSVPTDSFGNLFSQTIFQFYKNGWEKGGNFEGLSPPKISAEYQALVTGIDRLEEYDRYIYLLNTLGGLTVQAISEFTQRTVDAEKEELARIGRAAQSYKEINDKNYAQNVLLFTQFKNPSGDVFADIEIDNKILTRLYHDFQLILNDFGKGTKTMKKQPTTSIPKTDVKKNHSKRNKIIVTTAVCAVVAVAAVIILFKVAASSKQSTKITTYNVEEVTTGNVTSTISGSGTLTPVSKDTLTSTYDAEVTTVNFEVGDEVEKGDVIAVLTSDEHGKEKITAPYDGILLELPVKEDDEIVRNDEVAMIMGKDGFTLGIAVDETNISAVEMDQEADITIDALSGDYTGTVTAVSYNGSTSGSTTAYQITVTIDYVEGAYPGMSVSAQIVTEDSGEGLLVPVDAVETSGDDNYVYLAPDGAVSGDTYEENDIDVSDLTKVTVETGMSDGSYIIITSDEIEEGDLIVVTNVTSTQTGSDSDNSDGKGGGPGGMNFDDFDFENFDPADMPEGGGGNFPGGNFGEN